MPFFTVLLPVCNSEQTIINCLKSIEAQSFNDFNVLVLVNNSTDSSFDLCSSFCASRSNFQLINLHQSCPSLPDILNFGIRNVCDNCQYIVRHDSDDYMLPHRLEHTFASIRSSPVKPLIHCGNAFINNTHTLYFPSSLQLSDLEIKKTLLFTSPFIHPATCFKSSIPNLYDSRFQYAQDLKFFIDNIFCGLYSFTSQPYIHYTQSPSSSKKRFLQLSLHDVAINTLHKKLLHGLPFRVSHELRCMYVTDEYRMYTSSSTHSLHYIYLELITKFADVYKLSNF